MMFCKNCGNEVKEGAKFCAGCGAPVQAKAADLDKGQRVTIIGTCGDSILRWPVIVDSVFE